MSERFLRQPAASRSPFDELTVFGKGTVVARFNGSCHVLQMNVRALERAHRFGSGDTVWEALGDARRAGCARTGLRTPVAARVRLAGHGALLRAITVGGRPQPVFWFLADTSPHLVHPAVSTQLPIAIAAKPGRPPRFQPGQEAQVRGEMLTTSWGTLLCASEIRFLGRRRPPLRWELPAKRIVA